MKRNITYIHNKTIINPSQQFDNTTTQTSRDATGGGLVLIKKDSESCGGDIKVDVITTLVDTWTCYTFESLVNFIP
jgi:hypothetical protein